MTFTDDQFYDAARILVDGLEDGAAMEANCNAVASYYRGDKDEQRLWTRILRAVLQMQGKLPANDAAVK